MRSELMVAATHAALLAGDILSKGFGTTFEIQEKTGPYNLVTHYDKASEEAIYNFLMKRFPGHGFIGEECGEKGNGEVIWMVDPLDGTLNFAHGIPFFAVSIAAIVCGEIVVGCVYQPRTQELFCAEKGSGAFLNGASLSVTKNVSFGNALFATGFPHNVRKNPLNCLETFIHMSRKGAPIRRFGSAAIELSYLAAGRFDAYWEVVLEPWDFAAGKLIVEEAGGRVSTYDGSELDLFKKSSIVATNSLLHLAMLEVLSANS
jgi:myo-inositol-1(or 4)-monophosphatase